LERINFKSNSSKSFKKKMNFDIIKKLDCNKNLIIFLFFLIFFFTGISITKDYGVSSDEYNNRGHGFVTLNYITKKFLPSVNEKFIENKKYPELEDHKGRTYGVLFNLPAGILDIILKIEDKKNQFLLRHYLNFLIFFISTIFFFKIIIHKFQDWKLALFGTLALILTPRIFANSFYNNADLFFMSVMIIAVYYSIKFFENQKIKNSILCGLFSAFLIDIRILGLVIFFSNISIILLINFYYKKFFTNYKQIVIYTVSTVIFTIIFWPHLWENLIESFLYAFNEMSNYWINIDNLLFGKIISSKELPWYYVSVWILITTPLLYLLFFFIGLIFILKKGFMFFSKKIEFNLFYDFYFVGIVFSSLFVIILLNSTLYNGWRHMYFLYPLILLISINGLFCLFKNTKIVFIKYIFIFIISLQMLTTFTWMVKNHPHQYVFFNSFIKGNLTKKFELDYWGLSYKQSFEYLLKNDNSRNIKVYNLSEMKLFYHLFSLEESQRNRIIPVKNLDEADYLITNYYNDKNLYDEFFYKKFKVFFDIKVDNSSINTIFKKITDQ